MKQNEFIQLLNLQLAQIQEKKLRTKIYLAIKATLPQLKLQQDFKCPSTRFLSETLGVSRDTLEKVYAQLEQEGFFLRIKGKGTFIRAQQTFTNSRLTVSHTIEREIDYQLPENIENLEQLFFDQNLNFFADGMPEIRNFPFRKWYENEKNVLNQEGLKIFLKDNEAGDTLLREQITQLINLHRNTTISADQVLIVNSTQQALYLCGRVLFSPQDKIILENPYYSGAYILFKSMGLDLHCINLDSEGLKIQECAQISNPKAVYVTPANQYPSGIQMGEQRKKQIIEYAEKNNSYIIEDDYDALLLNKSKNTAILGLDPYQRTIYLGLFSKYILPSLRLSYLIVPKALVEPFKRYRNYIDGSAPSKYFQMLLANFMQKGHYFEYLRQMQQLYLQRYQYFIHYYDLYLADFCFIKDHHPSMQIACYFKTEIPVTLEGALVKGAELKGIALTALSQFYEFDIEYGFVLGFSSLNHTEIRLCMVQLRELIQNELARLT
ncbi:PLP-dependent aminotransferase family protein [Acinetobacter sp. ANC 4648]|uniref:aminotransferase-like domain-containing protein n=1 Tax=Acinetobacter sp. ANC 4648 TaxID=1977875 RepID=UPI000A32F202|nr:PLP-dependent aminotransferase family protein [Acinetobacter sp. ANC 4648]OTG80283.1 GntR family transcriptional regulator [Acinetobacter sp. ANC 4648]